MVFQQKLFNAMSPGELDQLMNPWLAARTPGTVVDITHWTTWAQGRMHYFGAVIYRS